MRSGEPKAAGECERGCPPSAGFVAIRRHSSPGLRFVAFLATASATNESRHANPRLDGGSIFLPFPTRGAIMGPRRRTP
jgi:hypothetical protein